MINEIFSHLDLVKKKAFMVHKSGVNDGKTLGQTIKPESFTSMVRKCSK
ncbi:hypothetical protein yfred0001_28070 [Yersinia frederiksenii ATCC 33641]|nr:hypothetical protein yfred0001_28070 [Yersinia frederiksenii ATCC 33641]